MLATSAAMLTLTIIGCTCWAMHSRWLRAYLLDLYTQLGNRPTVTPSMHYTFSIHEDPENSQSDDSVAMSEEDSTVSDTLAEQNHTNSSQ